MNNVLPGIGAVLIAIAALTATGTSTIGCILGFSRMLYAAREKATPPIFGKVNQKTGAFSSDCRSFHFNYDQGKKLRKSKPGALAMQKK